MPDHKSSIHTSGKVNSTFSSSGLDFSLSLLTSFYLDAVIEEDVSISHAIIGEGVLIRRGAVIQTGCVLADHVIIDTGVVLPAYSRVSLRRSLEVTFC